MAASDPRTSTDPFADQTTPSSCSTSSPPPADLLVAYNARLSLTPTGLAVYDPGLHARRRLCGLTLPVYRASTALQVPYHSVLSASLHPDPAGTLLTIRYALAPTYRPVTITYPLRAKTASEDEDAWLQALLSRAYPPSVQRQKRLLVLLNPGSGRGLAQGLYARYAAPVFAAAGCKTTVLVTTHVGHARLVAKDMDLDAYDAVVCCSGDGTPSEVFNGLADREDPRTALRRMAVVQVPCGSGNAMSKNLFGAGVGMVGKAAVGVVKGRRRGLDLTRVTMWDQSAETGVRTYWSFLSQSVGIVAETDLGTDNLRWMGPLRFTWGFLVRLLGKTVYPAEVSVKTVVEGKDEIRRQYWELKDRRSGELGEEERQKQDVEGIETSVYGTIKDPLPSDWETCDMPTLGNFYAGNMTWMASDAPFFAAAWPDDGLLDLITIDGSMRRHVSIKLLLSVAKNALFDSKEVAYRKVVAYRIKPRLRDDQLEGYISVDGERMPFGEFQTEVVRGLGTTLTTVESGYDFEGPPGRKR